VFIRLGVCDVDLLEISNYVPNSNILLPPYLVSHATDMSNCSPVSNRGII